MAENNSTSTAERSIHDRIYALAARLTGVEKMLRMVAAHNSGASDAEILYLLAGTVSAANDEACQIADKIGGAA